MAGNSDLESGSSTPSFADLLDDKQATDAETSDAIEGEEDSVDEVEDEESETETEESSGKEELVYEIDGQEYTAQQLKEFKDSGLRYKDYTQKTMKVGERSKELDAKNEQLNSMVQTLNGVERGLKELIESDLSDIDLEELRESDTSEYLRIKDLKEKRQSKLNDIFTQRDELQSKIIANEHSKLHESLGWDDSEKQKADVGAFNAYAKKHGFTQNDMAQITSANVMKALIGEARKELVAESIKGKKAKPKASKVAKPTTKKMPGARVSTAKLLYDD